MRLVALLIGCLFTFAPLNCGYSDHYDVYVLDIATPAEWVNEAVAEWDTFAGVHLSVHWPAPGVQECNADCITVRMATASEVKADCPKGAIACTHLDGTRDAARIELQEGLPDSQGRPATIHEFGHAFGLSHACAGGHYGEYTCPRVTTALTIMNPVVGGSAPHVACDDVHQYEEIRHWPDSPCTDPRLASPDPLTLGR